MLKINYMVTVMFLVQFPNISFQIFPFLIFPSISIGGPCPCLMNKCPQQ